MAGAAQADRTGRYARCRASGSTIASGIGQFGAIQSAAPSLGLEPIPFNVRDACEIERDIAAFARSANGGLIVTPAPRTLIHRDLIIALTDGRTIRATGALTLRQSRVVHREVLTEKRAESLKHL